MGCRIAGLSCILIKTKIFYCKVGCRIILYLNNNQNILLQSGCKIILYLNKEQTFYCKVGCKIILYLNKDQNILLQRGCKIILHLNIKKKILCSKVECKIILYGCILINTKIFYCKVGAKLSCILISKTNFM